MSNENRHDRDPVSYSPDETPPAPPMPTAERPEADEPRDYDSDPQNGDSRLPQPREGEPPATGGDAPSHGSR